jgi:hypothetical protein
MDVEGVGFRHRRGFGPPALEDSDSIVNGARSDGPSSPSPTALANLRIEVAI